MSSATEINYTAERVLRALELVVLRPSTAPVVAEAMGVHARTARRILGTLAAERFVKQRGGRGRMARAYEPTVRLLAVAAQLASRLPLVEHGRRGVEELHRATGLGAYIAVGRRIDFLDDLDAPEATSLVPSVNVGVSTKPARFW